MQDKQSLCTANRHPRCWLGSAGCDTLCTLQCCPSAGGLTWWPCWACRWPPATAAAAAVTAAAHSGLDSVFRCGDSAERCGGGRGRLCSPPSGRGDPCPCDAASKSAYALYAPGRPQLMVGLSVAAHSCELGWRLHVTSKRRYVNTTFDQWPEIPDKGKQV